MKLSKAIVGYVLISLVCLSPHSFSQDSDYVELPFEFFHGRWVQGHSGEFKSSYLDYRSPDYYGSYNFTFGSNRLSINDIQKYILVNHELESWRTADISFLKRVKPNWQVGIDRLKYSERWTRSSTSTQLPFTYYYSFQKDLTVSASSRYSKNRKLRFSKAEAPYSYFFEPILAKGELLIDNMLDLNYNNGKSDRYYFTDSLRSGQSAFGEGVSYYWNFESYLQWGISDKLNLKASLVNDYAVSSGTQYYESYSGGAIRNQSFRGSSGYNYFPSINVSVTSALGSNRFLKLEYGQQFYNTERESFGYNSSVALDSVIIESSKFETPLRSLRSHLALNLRLVKPGKFKSSIILDDYQDYYKGMLFDEQLVIDIGFKVSHFGNNYLPSFENYDLFVLSKVGISDKVNLEAWVGYKFLNFGNLNKKEEVHSYITAKFRNYNYDSQSGPSWNRDNRYDQMLGSILRPGNLYLEVRYVPPMFDGQIERDINLFSFDKFQNNGFHNVHLKFEIGLGRSFSATIDDRETYAKQYTVSRNYSLGMSMRILDHTNLSLSYNQSYYRSRLGDPLAKLSIKALI